MKATRCGVSVMLIKLSSWTFLYCFLTVVAPILITLDSSIVVTVLWKYV